MHILSEETFAQEMKETVEPYLAKHRTEHYFSREKEKRIYCALYEADEPTGIVLISHGFTETADKYFELIYYFLQDHYSVCIPEHCGHGRTYRLTPEKDRSLVHVDTWKRYVEDLSFVAGQAKARWPGLPVCLFAHSMGGGIGAALLAMEPALCSRAILTSPMIKPLTGTVPWWAAQVITKRFCKNGQGMHYVMGQHPYNEAAERYAESASTSRARYVYYMEKRKANALFQMSGASYEWLRQTGELYKFLHKEAVNKIDVPLLLFQAEDDGFVSNQAQEEFIQDINKHRAADNAATLRQIPHTRHEIFNADSQTVETYWTAVEDFLSL